MGECVVVRSLIKSKLNPVGNARRRGKERVQAKTIGKGEVGKGEEGPTPSREKEKK